MLYKYPRKPFVKYPLRVNEDPMHLRVQTNGEYFVSIKEKYIQKTCPLVSVIKTKTQQLDSLFISLGSWRDLDSSFALTAQLESIGSLQFTKIYYLTPIKF